MSQIMSSTINLNETDIYSFDTFERLQKERFDKGLQYYICVINEGTHHFQFDASYFFKNCIKDHKVISNPQTRSKVTDVQVYVSSKENPVFKFVMELKQLKTHPNHLPIYWNDPSFELHERLYFMMQYAEHYASIDKDKSISVYKAAAQQGALDACFYLYKHYMQAEDKDQALTYLKMGMEHPECSMKNLRISAQKAGQLGKFELAFKGYSLMAERGNLYGLAKVIQFFEDEIGQPPSGKSVDEWKKDLPPEFQSAPMSDFFLHLKESNYPYDSPSEVK